MTTRYLVGPGNAWATTDDETTPEGFAEVTQAQWEAAKAAQEAAKEAAVTAARDGAASSAAAAATWLAAQGAPAGVIRFLTGQEP